MSIKTKRELFRFNSQQDWVNKAQRYFESCGIRPSNYIAIASDGLVCRIGKQFKETEENDPYPVIVYELE